jgi:hypothetical protein
MSVHFFVGLWLLYVFALCMISSQAQDSALPEMESDDDTGAMLEMIQNGGRKLNIELPTLGGKQFWTDYRWWYGWRVQYNHTLDHWRLLDDRSIRKAWGTKEAMLEALEEAKQKKQVATEETEVPASEVVLR